MPIDISFGQLVVISGVNVNNDIVEASQYAIAYATTNGMLASTSMVLGGLSAETFSFSENVDISKNLELGGSIDLSGGIRLGTTLDVSGLSTFDNSMIVLGGIRLGKSGLPAVTLDISATDALRIPVGTSGQRPGTQQPGQIRYNTTTSQFEGYNQSSSWQGLGGVIDIDQDTKIIAETNPLDDNDEIQIYTAGVERLKVGATGTTSIYGNLDVSGTLDISGLSTFDNSMVVLGGLRLGQSGLPAVTLDISATDALRIPVGTSGQRPGTQQPGQIRYNTTTSQFEGYNQSSSWQGLGGVVDIDQDTKIIAETNPLDDNDEIQIYTAGEERMRVDACGNIQIKASKPEHVALDISATSAILLPKGTTAQRPIGGTGTIRSDISGAIRFNTDTSMCEVYTTSDIWSGIATYKVEQPPKLINISKTPLSESVTVQWQKFKEIYRDAFDGKSYPIYLQTFVDISYTNVNSQNSSGWKTIKIGNGNHNTSGSSTTPLTSITFNSVQQTTSSNTTGYSISFEGKPSTANLPSFTQDDIFELRIYGVNNSGKLPNYNYIRDVQLKITGEPGAVTVLNSDTFSKTQFTMDFSFDLDSNDSSVTSGISIVHYDISFSLSGTKSLESRTHNGNQYKHWSDPTSLSKNNINLTGLYPGAQYLVQVRAKNALKFNAGNASDGPSPTHLYKYGNFGNGFTSGYTNESTSRYINSSDLGSVTPNGMTISLNGNATINCHINGTNNRSNIKIFSSLNSNSSIGLSGTSDFYINYGKQGSDMNANNNALVTATFNIKNSSGTDTKTIDYKRIGLASADTVTLGTYQFTSSSSYTDKGDVSYNKGFVYSSGLSCSAGNANNTIFNANFPQSTNNYYLNYSINTLANNNSQRIDDNGDTSTGTVTTFDFYVDNYNSTPTITWNNDPAISVTSQVYLFGIPSINGIQATANFTISNYASNIIPYDNSRHSRVDSISKNCYNFGNLNKTNVYDNTGYTQAYSKSDNSITSNRYDANTTSDFTITVYYLNNTGTPTVSTYTNNDKDIPDIGHIFRDSNDTYSGNDLHFFNGSSTITGTSITTNSSTFATTYSSNISTTLLYFNQKFVSGGFSASYSSTTISPFSNWSSGFAVSGPDYSGYTNTGAGGFKWIAIDVTNKKSGNNIDLSNFNINGSSPNLSNFGTTYEAYISHDSKFGALKSVSNSGATLWFNDSNNNNITNAKTINGALQNNGIDGFIDSTTSGTIFLIVGLVQNANSYFTFS